MQKRTYYWMLSLVLISGTYVMCDKEIVKQQYTTTPLQLDIPCSALNVFKCKSGECIDESLICEGTWHCKDGSDEDKCHIAAKYHTLSKRAVRKTCVIPSINGHLYSNNTNPEIVLPHGSEVYENTIVYVHCEEGYYKNSLHDVIMSCQSGKWIPTYFKLCLKMCPPQNSDSLDITCTFNGNYADCTKKSSIPGTNLVPKCKSTHHLENGKSETPIELKCHDNGMWVGGELYSCQPTCGQENIQTKVLIVNGTKAEYGTAPWNVGIYYRKDDTKEYDIICGGTLISLNLVVSAAHCFWDGIVRESAESIIYSRYKVSVGKYARDIKVLDNEFTEFFDLLEIFLKHAYTGFSRSYADDIAVIVLKTKVTVSVVVSPVCMNWNSRFIIPNGAFGKVVGWGVTEKDVPSPILLEKVLQLFEIKNCLNKFSRSFYKYLTNDKFCVDDPSGLGGVNSGDSGAGLTYKYDNSYYLTGIVSSKDRENNYTGAIFTDVNYHIDWITQLYNDFKSSSNNITNVICSKSGDWSLTYRNLCSKTTSLHQTKPSSVIMKKNTCVIPSYNGNLYYLQSKPNNYLPYGSDVQGLTTVNVKCEFENWSINSSIRLTTVCKSNGEWSSIYPNLCSERCPPKVSDNLDFKCFYNGKLLDCSKPAIKNTKLIPKCKSKYNLPYGITETPIELHCGDNGKWVGGELYTCQPICGKIFEQTKNINGKEAKYSIEPWNVMIYKRENNTLKYDEYFGGSLISSNLVISAASYFWDDKIRETTITNLKARYILAIGEFTTYYKKRKTDLFDLLVVYLPETYIGEDSRYLEDIAVIVIDNEVTFSNVVAPVCIDWDKRYTVSNGSIGKIFNWLHTDDGVTSVDTIFEKQIPFIDQKSCRQFLPNIADRTFLTIDKFCSRTDGKYKITGAVGSGLTIEQKQSQFLTGILSIKEIDILPSMYFFTDIRYHINWVSQIYKEIISGSVNFSKTICSKSGDWSSTYRKLCSKICPSKKSDSLDITCTYGGNDVDCANQLSISGTILTAKCKFTHHLENGKMETPIELHCHDNGTWIGSKLYTCQPICGRVVNETNFVIRNKTEEKYGSAPWNVGIYDYDNDTNVFDMICGGTLISSKLVLSAAYCIWDDKLQETTILNTNNRYKIAVGKYLKEYEFRKDNIYTDFIDVLVIYLPDNYIGEYADSDDIAVVVLKTNVIFSSIVAPICVDWDKNYPVRNGSIVKTVTGNYTKENYVLLEYNLPFIDRKNCLRMLESGYYGYITVDKFCTHSKSGNITDELYVGGGLTSERNNSQFFTGIYNGFTAEVLYITDVSFHIEWIKQFYLNYTINSNDY